MIWTRSPLITTMPKLSIEHGKQASNDSGNIITENASAIVPSGQNRRTYFRTAETRKKASFTPDDFIECDFCQGLLAFEDGLSLSFPMVHFDLMQYWDGRPVWFVCCERSKDGKGPGAPIWCVGFEILKEGEEEDEEEDAGQESKETLPDISGDVD